MVRTSSQESSNTFSRFNKKALSVSVGFLATAGFLGWQGTDHLLNAGAELDKPIVPTIQATNRERGMAFKNGIEGVALLVGAMATGTIGIIKVSELHEE